MATPDEVNAFLLRIKAKVKAGDLPHVPRNLSDIAALGITYDHADEFILALMTQDYSKGPEDDHDGSPGEIWVFGAEMDGLLIYIKFKIDGEDARCLSFHEADAAMNFPLKRATQRQGRRQ